MALISETALRDIFRNPGSYLEHETYRSLVLWVYGVRPEMIQFIRAHSTFTVTAPTIPQGWSPPENLGLPSDGRGRITLGYFEEKGTMHECAHVLWHWRRKDMPHLKLQLAQAVVRLANETEPVFAKASDFAKGYVYGIGNWPGMYALYGKPKDLHALTETDLEHIIDWEIYAGFASYTMGQYRTGKRRLPVEMWRFLDDMFIPRVMLKPYYERASDAGLATGQGETFSEAGDNLVSNGG